MLGEDESAFQKNQNLFTQEIVLFACSGHLRVRLVQQVVRDTLLDGCARWRENELKIAKKIRYIIHEP